MFLQLLCLSDNSDAAFHLHCSLTEEVIRALLAQLPNPRCCLRSAGSRHSQGKSRGEQGCHCGPPANSTHNNAEKPLGACSESTLGPASYSSQSTQGTFLITQKNIKPDFLWLQKLVESVLSRNQGEKYALVGRTINPQGPAKLRSNGFGKRHVQQGKNKQQLCTLCCVPGLCCPDNPRGSALYIPVLNEKGRIQKQKWK